jgi:hypothetical protein
MYLLVPVLLGFSIIVCVGLLSKCVKTLCVMSISSTFKQHTTSSKVSDPLVVTREGVTFVT